MQELAPCEVGIERPRRPAWLHGGHSTGQRRGPSLSSKQLLCLERPWNKSCELLPAGPASWSCNLILGSPDVSICR